MTSPPIPSDIVMAYRKQCQAFEDFWDPLIDACAELKGCLSFKREKDASNIIIDKKGVIDLIERFLSDSGYNLMKRDLEPEDPPF